MRHDLVEPDEGNGKPVHLSVASLAAAVLLLAACGGEEPARSVLIASGRDDHGDLVQDTVGLSAEPEGPATAEVAAGSLVAVVDMRGEWIRVRSLQGTAAGWVNDYYLRGVVHLVAGIPGCPVPKRDGGAFEPNAQVELLEYEQQPGALWVRVRLLGGGTEGWVRPRALSELPARTGAAPASCPTE